MAIDLEPARLLVYKAGWLYDTGQEYIKEASMAKVLANEVGINVTTEAMQIHGGYGYMKDHPVERKRQEQIIKNRDNAQVTEALEDVREACQKGINIMPSLFKAARAMAWEVVDIFREVWGIWQPILPQRHRGHGVAHEAMSVFSVSL